MSPRSGVKRPRPRPQPAQGLFRAPARATFVCGDKSSQKHRQKLRFCTSSARYTALVCKVAPPRNRHFLTRCRSADCASTAFRCRCLLLRQKLFVLPCRRLRSNYILCPTGTPTFAAARRQRRDLIIATRPAHQPLPSLLSAAAARAVQAIPEPTTMSPPAPIPRDQHRQICTCPPRAKGPLDRRSKRLSFPHFFLRRKKCGRRRPPPRQGETDSPPRAKGSLNRRFEWFSLVTFFLQKKKVTRAGARNAPPRARRRKKRDGLRRLFLYLISCPCGSATPAPAPARISASCFPPPACRSGCPARSTSRTQTWPR